MSRIAPALVAAFLLAGCANTPAMRTLSARSAGYAAAEAQAGEGYFQAYGASVSQRAARTARYEESAAHERGELELTARIGGIAGRDAPDEILGKLKLSTAEDIVAAAAPPTLPSVSTVPAQLGYSDTAKLLSALATKPTALDQATSLVGFANSVNDALSKIQADAKAQKDAKSAPAKPADAAAAAAS